MSEVALWVVGLGAVVWILDRFLLWAESRGWVYYRRSKPGRGASTYHLLEWASIFDPAQREVIEVRVKEEQAEDEAGDPLRPGREDGPPGDQDAVKRPRKAESGGETRDSNPGG